MENLRKLAATVALTFILGVSAFAGETMTPPCAPPEPGETMTPPCATAQAPTSGEILTPPGQIDTPPAAVDEAYLTEIAASVMFSILSLF